MPKPEPSQRTLAEAALDRAIAHCGSRAELARRLGISRPAVAQWRVVPLARVAEVARLTDVPLRDLAPELDSARPDSARPESGVTQALKRPPTAA